VVLQSTEHSHQHYKWHAECDRFWCSSSELSIHHKRQRQLHYRPALLTTPDCFRHYTVWYGCWSQLWEAKWSTRQLPHDRHFRSRGILRKLRSHQSKWNGRRILVGQFTQGVSTVRCRHSVHGIDLHYAVYCCACGRYLWIAGGSRKFVGNHDELFQRLSLRDGCQRRIYFV